MSYQADGTAVCDLRNLPFHSHCTGPVVAPWPALPDDHGRTPHDTLHVCVGYLRWAFGHHCREGILGHDLQLLAELNAARWNREYKEREVRTFAADLAAMDDIAAMFGDRGMSAATRPGRRASHCRTDARLAAWCTAAGLPRAPDGWQITGSIRPGQREQLAGVPGTRPPRGRRMSVWPS